MEKAFQQGLIKNRHNAEDAAPKWFVLQVALNLLEALQKPR
jgi:hypothetical protein